MRRLPIRWRVTGAFAATLFVVLTAVGVFLYLRFEHSLSQTLDRSLRARAGEVSLLVQSSPAGLARGDATALETDESVAQVLRPDGSVVAGTTGADRALIGPDQLERARRGPVLFDRPGDELIDEGLRMLAVGVAARGEPYVVVVGSSADDKDESLSTLLTLELLGLGAALVLSAGAGYLVAGTALRPVEAMRRRAAEITDTPDQRLPVPAVDDEIGRLGATLNAMLERLARARAAEADAIATELRFVADASHELRTPLAILKGEIEVALLGQRDRGELRGALESSLEETDRLIRLAEDLLALTHSDGGGLPLRAEPVAVADLLDGVAARHRGRPGAASRGIRVDAPPGLRVTADPLRIQQALTNLVDNALRHGSGDVDLSAQTRAGEVRIAVRDHGPGFPEPFLPHAFERFSRADSARAGSGAGLGLAIAAAVAEAHGGTVTATNVEPGARVELRLPATLTDLSSAPAQAGEHES